ncbi:DUF4192 domain-containing protein [Pseudarthrobacter phenanthrenivorans]|uniref:DUF4192 domain-containing protein n=1 Tax=Pseudarthrobacter phenanthrenivorans TaxID=361575 RepID=UPI00344B90AD
MTAPERLTVRGPEDILGFIPHSLGYWPDSSLVAMTLHGTTLGATLRLDLPGPDGLADPSGFACAVRRYLESDREADGALLAVFTRDADMGPPSPYDLLVCVVESVLDQAGMPVRDAWYVGDAYWRDAWCTDASCCPPQGRPVQAIRDSTLNTEMVYRGSSVGPAPRANSRPAAAVPAMHLAAVREAQARWEQVLAGRSRNRAQFNAVLDFWLMLLTGATDQAWTADVERDAFLRATLLVPAWRDAVMVMAAAGRQAALSGAEQFGLFVDRDAETGNAPAVVPPLLPAKRPGRRLPAEQGRSKAMRKSAPGAANGVPGAGAVSSRAPAGYGEVLMGAAPDVPDWVALGALDRTLGELAVFGGPAAAAALTLRGWVAWCRGRGSYAAAYLGGALELEPGCRLAELLLELVGRGTLCGWAARKDSAWQKFHPGPAGAGEDEVF